MRMALILAVLALAAAADEKKEEGPPAKAKLLGVYYDGDERGGVNLWGPAESGLGFVFRQEGGKEVCHLLFFSGEGRGIAQEKLLPVERKEKENIVVIGGVACGWDPASKAIVLPKGRELVPGYDGGAVLAALQESGPCRYLLTEHGTAESLAKAEAKTAADAGEGGIWKRLVGTDYVDNSLSFPGSTGAGTGLRFFEEKGEKKCRVVFFGSGLPVLGETVQPVVLEGKKLKIGPAGGICVYQVDPASLMLTPEKEGSKPILPDRFILGSMLRWWDEISRRRVP